MNYGLFWLELLLIALLWNGAWIACTSRIKRKAMRIASTAILLLIPLLCLGALVAAAAALKWQADIERNWFGYALSLFLAFIVGTIIILFVARRRYGALAPITATWPRGWLALSWLIVVMMAYNTLGAMDLAARTQCGLLYAQANTLYLASLPPVISEDQNAAPLYGEAFALLKEYPGTEVHNPPVGDNDDFDPNESATIAYLKRHAPTIALLRKAAAMPACRFETDLRTPAMFPSDDNFNEVRSAANLLNLHARQAVAHDQTAEAMADVQAVFGMSRHVMGQPTIIYALVGFGLEYVGRQTLEAVLPAVMNPEELAALQLPPASDIGRKLQRSFYGEARWGLLMYVNMPDNVRALSDNVSIDRTPYRDNIRSISLFRAFLLDAQTYATLMDVAQDFAIKPYYQIKDKAPRVVRLVARSGLLAKLIVPSIDKVFSNSAGAQATNASCHVALAMTRYRLDHGSLPSKLDVLVPKYLDAIPLDPFDGKPLRLVIKGNDHIIYSIGPDGVDDGGTDMFAQGAKNKGDVIFTLKPHAAPASQPAMESGEQEPHTK